jgi:hypothetical protein
MQTQVIPSYLYTSYNDDEDVQAFVDAYNQMAQEYISLFASIDLPIYTRLNGSLLDWVGVGLYGVARPIVPSVEATEIGPYNTWDYNTIALNQNESEIGPLFELASDDFYKRVITWQFYKGDGRTFDIRWLKRRIARFLFGENGTAPNIDQTYQISVAFAGGTTIAIELQGSFPPLAAETFAYCVEAGILPLPFQYVFTVTI